ncbi:uncharacterized protein F5147DRAFT_673200 [Suillus discolor]|uniref:TEA domain-containing protein n=1 Tax=Suillus discolor TaxID=1912936 RepID=A0A9P7JZ45_9AGAM|nr:uncharacterized protein F5147DRAFT_673200 [Suillus discolor]KAG2116514.1 hypothetical protein F5147DRAFT_673200 [Suillus discolor]
MGKRRLRYVRILKEDQDETAESSHVKSFGRCQLIQSYILEKTGKNRTRKQVSSHLQRLKKKYKNDPTSLLSQCRYAFLLNRTLQNAYCSWRSRS